MAERALLSNKRSEARRENKVSQPQNIGSSQSISSPIDQILFLQRTIGNQAVGRLLKSGALQAKLRIGQPGDIYEQEADRMAEQVMTTSAHLTSSSAPAGIQRISGKLNAQMDSVPASVDQALISSGSWPTVQGAHIQPIIQKKDNGDETELEFVTVNPVEEARLKKMGITLPPGIKQTNPEDKCPKGYQRVKKATWFRCDESAGTKNLGCAFCTPKGQQCKCTDILQSLGHNRIIAPLKSGKCGDWFKITSPKKGAPILDVIKAEIPGNTDLDIHIDVIKQLGEDVDAGRYDVCLKGPDIHDDRLVPCGGSSCPTPKSSPRKKS
ncbi:MAG: hypothetical protein J5U19_01845 [Candidatus Methanoperedens sp.]|nr:hypothetical protein [Candidatus Methanoperedens sp.]